MRKKRISSDLLLLLFCMLLLFGFFYTKRKLDQKPEKVAGTVEAEDDMEKMIEENASFRKKEEEKSRQTISSTSAGTSNPTIRVLIKEDENAGYYHQKLVLCGNSMLHLNGEMLSVNQGEEVEITEDSPWFQNEMIQVEPEEQDQGITVTNLSRSYGAPCYQGNLMIYRVEEGLILINEVELEEYLRSVVPSEMPSSYEKEALKAQAVCARTYAWSKIRASALEPYHADVDDSISDQVYNNIRPQTRTDEAVAETRGEVLLCDGQPITAYFFSTSCGRTSTDEVWNLSGSKKYLKSVSLGSSEEVPETEEAFASFITQKRGEDLEAEDGWYRWEVTFPAETLNERVKETGIGKVESLTVEKRSEGGAAEVLLVKGDAGSKEFTGEYDIREFLNVKGIRVQKNDGTWTTEMNLLPSACFMVEKAEEENGTCSFTLLGGGYGHGVGMSQNAANHLAQKGWNYREILRKFYDNVTLGNLEEEIQN